jgi:mycothiol synthase
MEPDPPNGYTIRAARLDDARGLADLLNACTLVEAGVPWTNEDDMREDLAAPGFDLENDAALVLDETGGLTAGLVLYPDGSPTTTVFALGLVHPDASGRGLGTFVTLLGEERARRRVSSTPPSASVTVQGSRFVQNEGAADLFRDLGYECVRTWWRMVVELGDEGLAASLPDGIELAPFRPGVDSRAVYDALLEAFRDHWGEGMRAFEDWASRIDGGRSAPSFVLVAREGDQIAGALVARVGTGADPEAGSITELGVRRPWRGRGLGLALLHRAFAEFRRLGVVRARLIVDSESPTGATRLYDRAGMSIELAWDRWEKELRQT